MHPGIQPATALFLEGRPDLAIAKVDIGLAQNLVFDTNGPLQESVQITPGDNGRGVIEFATDADPVHIRQREAKMAPERETHAVGPVRVHIDCATTNPEHALCISRRVRIIHHVHADTQHIPAILLMQQAELGFHQIIKSDRGPLEFGRVIAQVQVDREGRRRPRQHQGQKQQHIQQFAHPGSPHLRGMVVRLIQARMITVLAFHDSGACRDHPPNSRMNATTTHSPSTGSVPQLDQTPELARDLIARHTEPDDPVRTRARGIFKIIQRLELQPDLEAAGWLFPAVEAEALSLDDVRAQFPTSVSTLVEDMICLPGFSQLGDEAGMELQSESQAEALRQMLIAMARDIRVVVLRLADQLHSMYELRDASPETQQRAAIATRELYAPLANRLGIWQLKWELEDLMLRFTEPETYRRIAKMLRERRADREAYIRNVVARLENEMQAADIPARVQGRPKHIYSIWKKMQRKGVSFDNLFDVRAVRILVDTVPQCYAALGVVHGLWRHVPHEFDDYIANPKENGYRSLHTAVIGPEDKHVEIQIRTQEMHEHSELGVAAHWRYKEGGGGSPAMEERIAWLRQLLEPGDSSERETDILERFQSEAFEDRIYTLTPEGDIIDLPAGATPVDFAFRVHTGVGYRCRGAKVNGNIVPLDTRLQNGDRVEILTGKEARPSRDWLVPQFGFVASNRTRAKIRQWFRRQDREENLEQGRQLIEQEAARLGVGEVDFTELAREFKMQSATEILVAVGRGDVTAEQVGRRLARRLGEIPETRPSFRTRPDRSAQGGVRVQGVGDLATTMARCCRPVPGDSVIGFITQGRGVSVHRRDCRNILSLPEEKLRRLIEVEWSGEAGHEGGGYAVEIEVEAWDRRGLLRDITVLLSKEEVNITHVETQTDSTRNIALMTLTVEIPDLDRLGRVLHLLDRLPNVQRARRKHGS